MKKRGLISVAAAAALAAASLVAVALFRQMTRAIQHNLQRLLQESHQTRRSLVLLELLTQVQLLLHFLTTSRLYCR